MSTGTFAGISHNIVGGCVYSVRPYFFPSLGSPPLGAMYREAGLYSTVFTGREQLCVSENSIASGTLGTAPVSRGRENAGLALGMFDDHGMNTHRMGSCLNLICLVCCSCQGSKTR